MEQASPDPILCDCCEHVAYSNEELFNHFKEAHPEEFQKRCIRPKEAA